MSKTFFSDIEPLIKQCIEVKEVRNPVEVVEIWEPCYLNDRERKRETHIEVLRLDGYWDSIYFKIGEEEKALEVYNKLKVYNRDITPLEKFHSSF